MKASVATTGGLSPQRRLFCLPDASYLSHTETNEFHLISRRDAKGREERLCLKGDAPLATQIGAKSAKASGTKADVGGK